MNDACWAYCPATKVSNGPIKEVEALQNGILRIVLETGSILDVPLSTHFKEPRLCPLRDETVWNAVDTNERFVHWYRNGVEVVELGWDELFSFAVGSRWV